LRVRWSRHAWASAWARPAFAKNKIAAHSTGHARARRGRADFMRRDERSEGIAMNRCLRLRSGGDFPIFIATVQARTQPAASPPPSCHLPHA
jgi:hypothetical protein